MQNLKKYFMTGLIILLPIALTLMILAFFFHFFTSPFLGVMSTFLEKLNWNLPKPFLTFVARLIILAVFIIVIFLLGLLGRLFIFKKLLQIGNKLLLKIPVLRGIYHTLQNITDSLLSTEKKAFKQAVRFPFPYPKSHSIGFISGEVPEECRQYLKEEAEPIFIPAAPYPITGFMLFVPKRLVKNIDLSREEAVQFIISCGVVTPPDKNLQAKSPKKP